MRHFLRKSSGASLAEIGLLVGLIAVLLISSLTSVGQQLKTIFGATANTLTNATQGLPIRNGDTPEPDPTYASCKEWFDSTDSNFTNNGVNEIYPNGASTPINVYCQGAMTLILAQYEADPVTNWNEGIQSDYDPTLASKKGFALSTSEIPSHSKIYFGQDLATPLYCLTGAYQTSTPFAPVLYPSCANAAQTFYIGRLSTGYYNQHNPDDRYVSGASVWSNSLFIEQHTDINGDDTTVENYNWAFSPDHTTVIYRGYAFGGVKRRDDDDPEAWTVWVE